jgi:Leucine-rich repeat (LRR) protein
MVPFLQRHTGIKRLLLGGVTNIITEMLRAIAKNLHHITTLNLSENTNLMTEELSINSTEYVISSLQFLGLCQSNITDSILMKWIGKLHNLNSIDLSYCNRITDQGVKIFGPMLLHLMEIDLSSNYNVASLSTNQTFPSRVFIVEPYPHDKVFVSESHGGGRKV